MIDALGVSQKSMKECNQFLDKTIKLLDFLKAIKNRNKNWLSVYRKLYFQMSGDTIVIGWPIDLNRIPLRFTVINEIVKDAHLIMNWGIQNGILFRGSFGIGDYITENNIILGSAVFDAHEWYEATNWFGIIFSPKSRLWIESAFEEERDRTKLVFESDRQTQFSQLLVRYKVPLNSCPSTSNSEEFWVIAWPNWYYKLMKKGKRYYHNLKEDTEERLVETPREKLLNQLFEIYGSKEAEPKYKNSIAFFDWYSNWYSKTYPLKEIPKEESDHQ